MKISIVIPAYNAEKYLAQTVNSVLAQTVTDWELVIVDDGSTDGTGALADAYSTRDPRIRAVHQPNGGLAAARNAGFSRTSPQSEFVVFLDSDDLWEPELLAALTEALDSSPEAAGAYAVARYIDGEGSPVQEGFLENWTRTRRTLSGGRFTACRPDELTTFACFAIGQCVPTPGALLVRRKAQEDVGAFDAAMNPCKDYDINIRLTRRGGLALVDRVLFHYRLHGSNMSGNNQALHRSERAVRRKQIADTENTPEQKKLLQQGFRLREREVYQSRMMDTWAGLRRREFSGAAKTFLYGQANLLRSLHGRP